MLIRLIVGYLVFVAIFPLSVDLVTIPVTSEDRYFTGIRSRKYALYKSVMKLKSSWRKKEIEYLIPYSTVLKIYTRTFYWFLVFLLAPVRLGKKTHETVEYILICCTYIAAVLDGKSRGTCLIPWHLTVIRVWPNCLQVHFPGWTSFKQHKPDAANHENNMNCVRPTYNKRWAEDAFSICRGKASINIVVYFVNLTVNIFGERQVESFLGT